ncbi:MAG: YraN family protein [Candidatus Eisenbacteria bacterium]|nr:YraN family protein [Candidatus Eisenbacteria bacterium]
MNTTRLGELGELVAAAYLCMKGLRVLDRRYRSHGCEVDVVAADRGTLVFVEVKLRGETAKAPGRRSVDRTKQRRIVRAALAYLKERRHASRRVRFDVVEIRLLRRGLGLEHIPDAFRPPAHGGRWSSCWRRS